MAMNMERVVEMEEQVAIAFRARVWTHTVCEKSSLTGEQRAQACEIA
jgi:hypothetical protein